MWMHRMIAREPGMFQYEMHPNKIANIFHIRRGTSRPWKFVRVFSFFTIESHANLFDLVREACVWLFQR